MMAFGTQQTDAWIKAQIAGIDDPLARGRRLLAIIESAVDAISEIRDPEHEKVAPYLRFWCRQIPDTRLDSGEPRMAAKADDDDEC